MLPPPTQEPITVEAAKRHCNVFHDDDDEYVGELIAAVREHVEAYCGRCFGERTVTFEATDWNDLGGFPAQPVTSVDAIGYIDTDGAEQTVDEATYVLRNGCLSLVAGAQWPTKKSGSLVAVEVKLGVQTPAVVRHAMLLVISDLYERRETATVIGRTTFDNLLANHRYY